MDDATAPLKGLLLRVADPRVMRAGLAELLDSQGLKRLDDQHRGSPRAAADLPALNLVGVAPGSRLGEKLADKTIAAVAGMGRTEFITMALQGVAEQQRKSVERQAALIWARANRVVKLSQAWGNP